MAQLSCTTASQIGAVTGQTYVKAFYNTWGTGQALTVCALVKTEGIIGLVPVPNSGYVRSKTDMSIEVPLPVPAGATSHADALPAGENWTWCS